MKQLFYNEVNILASLDHPNVLRFHDFFQSRNAYHLVTEYLPGVDLYDFVKKRGCKLPEEEAGAILRQLLLAVKHCHSKGVVHRDIKPENVFLSPEGKVTLIDFGLAKYTEEKDCDLVGTSYYLAPEMIRGRYDERCDVWSVGAVAFMMLTTYVPFGGRSRSNMFRKILSAPLRFPANAKVSNMARDIVRRLLEKDVCRRITIEIALRHPFVAEKGQGVDGRDGKVEEVLRKIPVSTRVSSQVLNELGEQNSFRFTGYASKRVETESHFGGAFAST